MVEGEHAAPVRAHWLAISLRLFGGRHVRECYGRDLFQTAMEVKMSNFEKPDLPGFVVLGKAKTDNAYQGIIENSFSMSLSKDRVNFFWSSDRATSNLTGGVYKVDGKACAERYQKYFAERHLD